MRILLDTNILIHREANRVINENIGILFNWFDKLHYEKCIHPLSLQEIRKHKDIKTVKTIETKIKNYNLLKTKAPESINIQVIRNKFDKNENDEIDTSLLNEVLTERVKYLITEDRNIHKKALELGIAENVFSIDEFLEKVSSENPSLTDYKTLSVRKEYFGNIDLTDQFFTSFRNNYQDFDRWFNSKSDEVAYVCRSELGTILAFLYVKIEDQHESYHNIEPSFEKKRRLKIGTFKVISNGYKLGERFLKIVFDNALINRVAEVYVTLFDYTEEHERLIGLLVDWGFYQHGIKHTPTGDERVYVKNFHPAPDSKHPKQTYPFIDRDRRYFIVPIYPEYHTELFPDSILNNESPTNFVENQPHRNAIQKAYISRSYFKNLLPGDVIVFYRTGGYYKGVATTIGVVENVYTHINSENNFISLCRKRSVFTDTELSEHWNYNQGNRPFVVNFLYIYAFPKRPNLKSLINMGVIRDISSAPRGFEEISRDQFELILKAAQSDESFIIN